jgi:hypothetical protein
VVVFELSVPLDGDYNDNGVVDAGDFLIWRNTLGQVGPDLAADGNQNGEIDFGDYSVWRETFGQIVSSGSGSLASSHIGRVPEPAALLLVVWGTMLLNCARRSVVSFLGAAELFGKSLGGQPLARGFASAPSDSGFRPAQISAPYVVLARLLDRKAVSRGSY